ncbi:hypothetical protein BT67DRAFT_86616 [Trichocladium antarcticum]|uniref:Uncharacterized protein n=1 Tax=Trichocladium antarcticum TaxID=1450529 RepID=A0AAN6ZC35_9PEZI|nr:hypothetical protein BT67DRAFT_86616 [Trichocladium antarcticum]
MPDQWTDRCRRHVIQEAWITGLKSCCCWMFRFGPPKRTRRARQPATVCDRGKNGDVRNGPTRRAVSCQHPGRCQSRSCRSSKGSTRFQFTVANPVSHPRTPSPCFGKKGKKDEGGEQPRPRAGWAFESGALWCSGQGSCQLLSWRWSTLGLRCLGFCRLRPGQFWPVKADRRKQSPRSKGGETSRAHQGERTAGVQAQRQAQRQSTFIHAQTRSANRVSMTASHRSTFDDYLQRRRHPMWPFGWTSEFNLRDPCHHNLLPKAHCPDLQSVPIWAGVSATVHRS